MKKINPITSCSLAILILLLVSCSKEPVTGPVPQRSSTNPPNPSNPPNPPNPINPSNPSIGSTSNSFPVDSLTGQEFVFNNLSWTLDGIYLVCDVNRPDLFYLVDRPLDVSISINQSAWMNLLMCPYPTDPFYYMCLLPGILRVYHYNYPGPLLESTTSIKVRFL